MTGIAEAQFAATNAAAGEAARRQEEKKQAIKAWEARRDEELREEEGKPAPADPAATLEIHDGDPIVLRVVREVSSKTAKQGDPVALEVGQDVKVGDAVVIPAGAHAMAEVLWVVRSPGELELVLDYVKAGERKVHLRGTTHKQMNAVALIAAASSGPGVLFAFAHNEKLAPGMEIKGYIGEDMKLAALVPTKPVASNAPALP